MDHLTVPRSLAGEVILHPSAAGGCCLGASAPRGSVLPTLSVLPHRAPRPRSPACALTGLRTKLSRSLPPSPSAFNVTKTSCCFQHVPWQEAKRNGLLGSAAKGTGRSQGQALGNQRGTRLSFLPSFLPSQVLSLSALLCSSCCLRGRRSHRLRFFSRQELVITSEVTHVVSMGSNTFSQIRVKKKQRQVTTRHQTTKANG